MTGFTKSASCLDGSFGTKTEAADLQQELLLSAGISPSSRQHRSIASTCRSRLPQRARPIQTSRCARTRKYVADLSEPPFDPLSADADADAPPGSTHRKSALVLSKLIERYEAHPARAALAEALYRLSSP